MQLSELQTGERAIVVKVSGYGGFRKRIVEMGFIKGKIIECRLNAPLKDPVKYSIMGYEVSLRRSEAAQIEVIGIHEAETIVKQQKHDYQGTITDEDVRKIAIEKGKTINVALIGNPNSGKTSLFNIASGKRERVGNYSGVTVEAKSGRLNYKGYTINITDLPGTYSLSAYSPEEKYVRQHIVYQKPDVIINVIDASNLERNLFLTTQLIDMNVRIVVALNMYDELQRRGDKLDISLLSKLLGVPIVPTVSPKKIGISQLLDALISLYEGADIMDNEGNLIRQADKDTVLDEHHHQINLSHQHYQQQNSIDNEIIKRKKHRAEKKEYITVLGRHIHINYGILLENSINELRSLIMENSNARDILSPRYQSIKLLENDMEMELFAQQYSNFDAILHKRNELATKLKDNLNNSVENAVMDAQYGFIAGALRETYQPVKRIGKQTLTDKIDNIVTHKIWGYPIFFAVIFIMFEATFYLGAYPVGWIESFTGWCSSLVEQYMQSGMFKDLLITGIIGGVGSVLVFLPNILILYLFITLLESTGYMARAAFIMDKIMHLIGLHGRSFIPLIMGFGCNVPAIMATRTIENHNSRMITILISPLMSCNARLPVYVLMCSIFFKEKAGLYMFAIYLTGIVLAGVMAKILKRFLFEKEEIPFVMELPPYRMPPIKSVLSDTWGKGYHYLKKIATVVLVGSIVIWFLSYFPHNQQFNNFENLTTAQQKELQIEQKEHSYLGQIGKFTEPIMRPLGFEWKTSVAILSGLAAKEVVVSTLAILYTGDENPDNQTLGKRIVAELKPNKEPAFTAIIAIELMLFVLIYFPCLATLAAIKHETGSWKWAAFVVVYTLLLAWGTAFLFRLIATGSIFQQSTVIILIAAVVLTYIIYKSVKFFRQPPHACKDCKGCKMKKE
ncbi:MAG: ferrous iron transport protein B [Bacteroidales bacterium]|jgi:ferrous iron transport protein B|nr:ferrous iron transport protein B [Bacteroidales bacterium]